MHYDGCMPTLNVRGLALAVAVAALAPFASGCYVEAEAPPPAYVEGYQPEYYDGYVVYYDDGGRPFYYMNGAVVWIPPSSPYYARYSAHWRTYGPYYRGWYANHGYRYHTYRHPSYRR
jgi:hypothetical protein